MLDNNLMGIHDALRSVRYMAFYIRDSLYTNMIAKYNRKSLMLGIPGLVLQIGCIFISNLIVAKAKSTGDVPSAAMIGACSLGSIIGSILLIVGLCYYAKAKGYSAVLGLLGLLSCLGLLILAVLPDKTKGMNQGSAAPPAL